MDKDTVILDPLEDSATIHLERFEAMLDSHIQLEALKAHGVDNWSGYGDAMASLVFDEEE